MQALKKENLTEDGFRFSANEPEPQVGHRDVKIRVVAASICGTDQGIYQITLMPGMGDEMLLHNGGAVDRYGPIIVGQEFSGEVVEVGVDVDSERVSLGVYVTF